jgi:hypothetical protein
MIGKTVVRLLLLAGIAANVALLFINASPARPHLGRKRAFKLLLRMSPEEAAWAKHNAFDEFATANDLELEVEALPTYAAIVARLEADKAHPGNVLLVDLSDELTDDAKRRGLIRPIADGATPESLAELDGAFEAEALTRAHEGTKTLWSLPARAEVDVALFLRPAVEDAYLHWGDDRARIDAAIKQVNGVGLPRDYALERSPDDWDSFDLFVAGWYWAHHPALWAGQGGQGLAPRLAIRTGDSDDALRELLASFYAQGAKDEEIAAGKLDTPALIDAVQWQALWRREGILVTGKSGRGVDADEIRDLLLRGELAWAPASPALSFRVHGGARAGSLPGTPRPSDLAWAGMPRGVSLELKDGQPARRGRTFSFQEMSFWAVPARVTETELAYRLARFITEPGISQREAEALGTLPVRTEIRRNYPILFRLAWMQNIFDASFVQIDQGSGDVPDEVNDLHLDERFRAFRRQAVFERESSAPIDRAAIQKLAQELDHAH